MKENYPGFRVEELWVFIGIDDDGDEGVMAFQSGQGVVPLVAADETRRRQLEPIAKQIAEVKGGTYECRHFIHSVNVDP